MVSRKYEIMARTEEQLNVLEQLLLHIEYLGNIGASRNLLIRVDGDGSAQISIKDEDGLFLSDYRQLKVENPTEQETKEMTISGTYDLD